MKDLVEALMILAKYVQDEDPTHCEHDLLYVKGPKPQFLTTGERKRLKELSFDWDRDSNMWTSSRFGSC